MSRNGPGVFIFPFHGLALYFYSSSPSSSSHLAMDMERNSSISLYHGFMTDLYRNLFMGLDRIWNLDLDLDLLRFHLLLSVEGLCLFTFRLVLSWQHACPCPCPCPLTLWAFPTPPHPTSVPSVLALHLFLCSRRHHHTLHYLPLPQPFLRPFISRHPSASAKPVPKDSSRAAVTYFTNCSHSHSFLYIYNVAREGCIYCTYVLAYWPGGFFSLCTWC